METKNDEIDLVDVWRAIVERKHMIAAGLVISLILAICYLFLAPPAYEAKALLAVGQVQAVTTQVQETASKVIEQPDLILQRLPQQYAGVSVEKDKKGAPNVLIVKARGESPDKAEQLLKQAVESVINEHNQKFDKLFKQKEEYIAKLDKDISAITAGIARISDSITRQASVDSALAAILIMQKDQLERQRSYMEKERLEKEILMSEIQNYPTKVIGDLSTGKAVKVSPKPTIATAIVAFGTLFSVFVAAVYGTFRRGKV